MSEWVPTIIAKPPESRSVLLYIVFYHPDKVNVWDTQILTGFYADEDWDETGFYLDEVDSDGFTMKYRFLEESDQVKVLAWTLLPRRPYDQKFNREEWSW